MDALVLPGRPWPGLSHVSRAGSLLRTLAENSLINVLSSPDDRLASVRAAARFVRPGGHLLIAARSESAIAGEARRGRWAKSSDGWISAPGKGTFQKGVPTAEIAWLMGAIGFQIADCALRVSSDVSWLLSRRSV